MIVDTRSPHPQIEKERNDMRVNRKKFIRQPFILNPAECEKIWNYLQTFTKSQSVVAICAEELTREFSSLAEFLEYENSPTRDVIEVGFNAWSEDFKTQLLVSFSKRTHLSIFVKFKGDEDAALRLDEFILERLNAMKPWYEVLTKEDVKGIVVTLLLQWIIVTVILIPLYKSLASLHITTAWLVSILAFIGIIIHALITALRKAYFPIGVFLIGQGVKRHEDKDRIRTLIIVGFIVNLFAGLVMLLLSA
jgi:hypothetical protein